MHRLSKYALSFILPVLILLLWFWVSEAGFFPPLLLPGPDQVARRAVELLCTGELARHAASSMARVAAGFLISSLCALALAFWLCRSPLLERTLDPLLEALRVVPPLSLIPLLILWLGIDEAPKLAIVVLASFFPIYLSSLSSLKRVLAHYRELAQVTFAFRIFDHDVDISYSTRERAEFRNHMATLGVTSMSAGSKTDPGGYRVYPTSLEQFTVSDERTPSQVEADIRREGYEVVWKDWDKVFD